MSDGATEKPRCARRFAPLIAGYQVMLVWPNERERESDTDRLLGWYSGVHSKLTADIKAGSNTLPVFDLPAVNGPPEEVQGVPGRN